MSCGEYRGFCVLRIFMCFENVDLLSVIYAGGLVI